MASLGKKTKVRRAMRDKRLLKNKTKKVNKKTQAK